VPPFYDAQGLPGHGSGRKTMFQGVKIVSNSKNVRNLINPLSKSIFLRLIASIDIQRSPKKSSHFTKCLRLPRYRNIFLSVKLCFILKSSLSVTNLNRLNLHATSAPRLNERNLWRHLLLMFLHIICRAESCGGVQYSHAPCQCHFETRLSKM
jgi:hypothetical protein